MRVRRKKPRGRLDLGSALVPWLALASSFVALLLVWIFGSARLLGKQSGESGLREAGDSHGGRVTPQEPRPETADGAGSTVALFLDEQPEGAIRISTGGSRCRGEKETPMASQASQDCPTISFQTREAIGDQRIIPIDGTTGDDGVRLMP